MSLHSEIHEQPLVFQRLLAQQDQFERIAAAIKEYHPRYAFLAARGTSDNAARYANYLWGSLNRFPVALATPSLFTYYRQPPILEGALVVGVSQSGQSPDILAVIEEGSSQDCLTLAITNDVKSPLARASDLVIDVQAGKERAVPATKSYTAELLAMAMLSAALSNNNDSYKALVDLPEIATTILELEGRIAQMATRYRFMTQCVVIGRGYNYATAFEWSLKLKELTYIISEPYSSADFLHGPIAMVDHGFPVLVIAPSGKIYDSMLTLIENLHKHKVELVVISDHHKALSFAQSPIKLPEAIPEWLSPLIAIIPAQLFSYHLALIKGIDAESPRRLTKITETH